MGVRVVAISHTHGARGESIGRIVSDRLGFRYVDEEIISTAAAREGLDSNVVADAERRQSFLARFADTLAKAGVAVGSVGFTIPDASDREWSDDFRRLIIDAILEIAERGDVVIVAHGASIALAGRDHLLRVFITAPEKRRAQRLVGNKLAEEAEAEKVVSRSDAARADYLRRFYAVDRELPTHYDLVLNTDMFGPEEAAEIVIRAARLDR